MNNKFKVGDTVYNCWELLEPNSIIGSLHINKYYVTRVITDKSDDLIKGDYVVKSDINNCGDRQFYSEIDLLNKEELLEKVEKFTNRNKK
jgi:hypothetical protein|tara:strand:+ start:1029 stop:1298 length:270 start_codon:yes stop_codon:yes gene_type:complete